jgi:DnaJ-class molecular chaperone
MIDTKEVKCGLCNGKGSVTLNIGARACSSCKGAGKIKVPSSYKKCNNCRGTGKIGWRQCKACNATGWK